MMNSLTNGTPEVYQAHPFSGWVFDSLESSGLNNLWGGGGGKSQIHTCNKESSNIAFKNPLDDFG